MKKGKEQTIKTIRMGRNGRIFLYIFTTGLLTHGYRLTNRLYCEDSFNYLETVSVGWTTSLGRIFLPFVEKVRGPRELTWLIGLLSILFIAGAAVLIADMFDIRGNVGELLLSWIMVAHPAVTGTFGYMYTADGYFFGMFLAVAAAWLIVKKTGYKGLTGAILCLAVSLGFYQAYISLTILLLVIVMITELLDPKTKWKQFWKMCGRFLLMGILAAAVYIVAMKICWKIGHFSASGYMGFGQESSKVGGIDRIVEALADCYYDFIWFMVVRFKVTIYNVTNILMIVSIPVLVIAIAIRQKTIAKAGRMLLIALLGLMIPIFAHIFELVSTEVSYQSIPMMYPLTAVFLMPVILAGKLEYGEGDIAQWKDKAYVKKHVLKIAVSLLMFLISAHFTVIANRSYQAMEVANTRVENLINRLQMRIEMTDGYYEGMPLAVVGNCYKVPEYIQDAPMMSGVVSDIFLTYNDTYAAALRWYTGYEYSVVSKEQTIDLIQTEEFEQMKPWPDASSVKVIDGTMVLYLSDAGYSDWIMSDNED